VFGKCASSLPGAVRALKQAFSLMKSGTLRITAATVGGALALAGCTPLTPEETSGPGPFAGAGAASAASDITRGASANTGERYATGAVTQTAASATTFVIAKHQATQRQRQVAIQRARAVQKRLVAERVTPTKRTGTTGATASRKGPAKKMPRYIAVETVREATTAPQAKKTVMIWDTQAEDIVGNSVYDISTPPPVGATSRFETYAAEYVGAGL
jgi:hypothetical protein